MACVEEYFQCLARRQSTLPNNMAKARVHAWLASHSEPDLCLGEAAEKGYWPWESVILAPLRAFLQAL